MCRQLWQRLHTHGKGFYLYWPRNFGFLQKSGFLTHFSVLLCYFSLLGVGREWICHMAALHKPVTCWWSTNKSWTQENSAADCDTWFNIRGRWLLSAFPQRCETYMNAMPQCCPAISPAGSNRGSATKVMVGAIVRGPMNLIRNPIRPENPTKIWKQEATMIVPCTWKNRGWKQRLEGAPAVEPSCQCKTSMRPRLSLQWQTGTEASCWQQ